MSEILKKIFSIKNSKSKSGKVLTIFGAQFSIDFSKSCQKIIEKTPVVENRILFANFTNKGFGCSPKYIAQEIIKQNLPYELLWIVKNPRKERKNFPKEIKLIKDTFLNSIKAHASSKIWISNHRKSNLCQKGLIKKSGQIYFQTWHGMMPLKKIEKDAYPENSSSERLAKIDSSNIDYLLSGAQRDNELFKRVFYGI